MICSKNVTFTTLCEANPFFVWFQGFPVTFTVVPVKLPFKAIWGMFPTICCSDISLKSDLNGTEFSWFDGTFSCQRDRNFHSTLKLDWISLLWLIGNWFFFSVRLDQSVLLNQNCCNSTSFNVFNSTDSIFCSTDFEQALFDWLK
jgi:hypothetical protein